MSINTIALMQPKIVTLLTILIPHIGFRSKLILSAIWLLKLIIDCDTARPQRSGKIYRLTEHMNYKIRELIVTFIQAIPAIIFLIAAILMKTWIPLIPGVISIIVWSICIIECIIDIIVG